MGIRGWFARNKSKLKNISAKNEKSIYRFLDKEGFYIILFLCVCVVAVTAVWVTKTNIDRLAVDDLKNQSPAQEANELENQSMSLEASEVEKQAQGSSSIVIEDLQEGDESIPAVTPPVRQQPEEEKTEESSSTEASAPKPKIIKSDIPKASEMPKENTANVKVLSMPVKGRVGMEYASDKLVYSKTLDQFDVHYGIDILTSENTPVAAAKAGEVVEVAVDSKLGVVIALDHGNELMTRYANLKNADMVKVGDWVEQGQVIGGVGKTALFEIEEEPHLHFEVLLDGSTVDPKKYLPIK